MSETSGYDFGANWRTFIDHHLTDERIDEARRSLLAFIGEDLEGKRFLDIGCGSGVFSLAAHQSGARRVVSIDINPRSVECCRELWRRVGSPDSWQVQQGSVLDEALIDELGTFDVVYSWGVLHHTGQMWRAIELAARCVAEGGLFYIAIYNKADGLGIYSDGRVGNSRMWELEKTFYDRLPAMGQRVLDGLAAAGMVVGYLGSGRNPVAAIRAHKQQRGMSWMVDIRDWLGGLPYEYAAVDEVFRFVRDRCGMTLENLISTNSLRNNEFLFRRPAPR